MSYKLEKPYTTEEKDNFIFKYNQDCFQEGYHCRIEETETALYALEDNEIMVDGEPQINPDYEKEQEEKEKERVNNLIMTALDFIGVLEGFGLDYVTEIKPFLEDHQDLDKQLKYCQNVWCGVVKQLCPIVIGETEITVQMIEYAFKHKHGEV